MSSNASDEPILPRLPEALVEDIEACQDSELKAALLENVALRKQIANQTHLLQLMTHQFATPLTSLSGSLAMLEEAALSAEQSKEFLEFVHQDVNRLQELLQDIQSLQNLETGKLETHTQPFCIANLVEEVMQGFSGHTPTYEFEPAMPEVKGDRWQTAQVLVNLISNAVKYSPDDNPIEIGASRVASDWIEVWVRDHGLGIPEADQPHVFERFYRVKHRDRQHIHGTGLGLSLCKRLIENQGGTLGFESKHGEGSRFFFRLPIWNEEALDPGSLPS